MAKSKFKDDSVSVDNLCVCICCAIMCTQNVINLKQDGQLVNQHFGRSPIAIERCWLCGRDFCIITAAAGCSAARWRIEKLSVYIATATSAICSIRLALSLYSADVCICSLFSCDKKLQRHFLSFGHRLHWPPIEFSSRNRRVQHAMHKCFNSFFVAFSLARQFSTE